MSQLEKEIAKSYLALTKHPNGSARELWSVAFPLMLSALSFNLMLFVDRVVLANYSLDAMNASAVASMACFLFIYFFIGIVTIAEIFVGQLNGSGDYHKLGQPVWQMLWLSLFSFLIFIPIAYLTYGFFIPERFIEIAKNYYIILLSFAPISVTVAALSTFFIGQGKSRVISVTTLISNILNMILNILLVFGYKNIIPEMGIIGSAIATICSQFFQLIILLVLFLSTVNRKEYGSLDCRFRPKLFSKCMRVGLPSAFGHMLEIAAWTLLVNMISRISDEHLTVMNIGQSIFIIIACINDGMQKGVSAVASNFIGAQKLTLIPKCLSSAIKLQLSFSIIVLFLGLLFKDFIPSIFLPDDMLHKHIITLVYISLLGVWIFFIFDGMVWILAGILTAAEDTLAIMLINAISVWLFAILPIYIFIFKGNAGAEYVWGCIAIYAVFNFLIFFIRYKTNQWVKKFS